MQDRRAILLGLILMFGSIVCGSPTSPELPDGAIRVNGTVQYFNFEGGFWAVRGDDGVTYDPIAGLSPAFQRENLRVTLVAKIRTDMASTWLVRWSKSCQSRPDSRRGPIQRS